jgi:enolase-phosphatase E1
MIKAIVTDIEGTTSSIAFVKDVLFPYARAHIAEFVQQHQHQAEVQALLQSVSVTVGQALSLEQTIHQLIQWIDEDQKITALKALQGLIWQDGYYKGAFAGHIYPEVAACLKAWYQQGIQLYVYSSGSVAAQQLLFSHTDDGDLTPLFFGYFDTRIGAKQEINSYTNIANIIGIAPADILFLSDIKAELDAAHAAGFQVIWLVREDTLDSHAAYRQVRDFNQINAF